VEALIIGAGIGGLTLALQLHRAGIGCRVFEAAPDLKPIGVGVSLLPHSVKVLAELGLLDALAKVAITTRETVFYNRFGQFVHGEPTGRHAGYEWPQFQIHRADLHAVLLDAFHKRVGKDCLSLGWKCTGFTQEDARVTAHFVAAVGGGPLPPVSGTMLVGCDGLHSAIRKQLHPDEGDPVYSGVNMWRGVTRWKPFRTGASYVRAGWLTPGKLVIYPVRDNIDGQGTQLINWVAEVTTPKYEKRDWNRPGRLEDFMPIFDDWHFDWLDAAAMLRASDIVLEFPMIDQDPLPWWTQGRVTLLGDAAHPMVPRGSNGAGQAILDSHALLEALATAGDIGAALKAYEAKRLPATAKVVLTNRANPPDAILREVYLRTGDKPFARIEDVISQEEIRAISDGYKRIAGYDRETVGGTDRYRT
jgi:2-polyprenyl-6-methoxyphenol hydroxylase-like FAD-dependent oxidoreductase